MVIQVNPVFIAPVKKKWRVAKVNLGEKVGCECSQLRASGDVPRDKIKDAQGSENMIPLIA